MIIEDAVTKLEEIGGAVNIERESWTAKGGLPWHCDVRNPDGLCGYGKGSTLLEAIEDAFEDLERDARSCGP